MCSSLTAEPAAIEQSILRITRCIAAAAERGGRSPSDITMIAVTKTVNSQTIQQAFAAGIRHFGESRVQEAREKIPSLSHLHPRPVWHMVGHLQTNKAKVAVELFDMIHSVDSIKVAEAISQHAIKNISVLIQVNIGSEVSKHGFAPNEVATAVREISRLPKLEIGGLMTIAPYTDDPEEVRPLFRSLRLMRDSLGLKHLSMGMSHDFEVAIEEGATLVRIGRAIFGERGE